MSPILHLALAALSFFPAQSATRSKPEPPPLPHAHIIRIDFQLTRVSRQKATVHWKIANHNEVPVYAYSNFLWGPQFSAEHEDRAGVVNTAPLHDTGGGCQSPFPPLLLLIIPANDFREGDFTDPALKDLPSDTVSMRIALGPESDRVTSDVYRAVKTCKRNPFDVVFDWSTFLESPAVAFPKDSQPH